MFKKLLKLVISHQVILTLLLIVQVSLLVMTQFTAWPEMLIYPYLMSRGFSFYGDIIQPYMPTLPYGLLGFFHIFGLSVASLHLITIITILLGDVLMLFVLKRYFSKLSARFVLSMYIAVQILFEGNGLWFDLATVPVIFTAFYCFLNYQEKKQIKILLMCAALLGVVFTIKQTAFWYLTILLGILIFDGKPKRIIPVLIVWVLPAAAWYLILGKPLLDWAVIYPFTQMSRLPGFVLWPTVRQLIAICFIFLPWLFLVNKWKGNINWVLVWLIASFGFLLPRFAYFHLQPAIPFLVIIMGNVWQTTKNIRFRKLILFSYTLIVVTLSFRFFLKHAGLPPRFFESEVEQTTVNLEHVLPKNEQIFFYNDMGNYMILGKFLPLKPWAYNFPWYMEIPGMQEKIVSALENGEIRYIMHVPFGSEGEDVPGSYVPKILNSYVTVNYDVQTKLKKRIEILYRKR